MLKYLLYIDKGDYYMARKERNWHPDFSDYMRMIVEDENYRGLQITERADGSYTWVTTANSEVGKARKAWAEDKARNLGFTVKPGVYADVMREIHPTKIHVCQICGSKMSIYYHYPSVNFLKALNKEFEIEFTECDHIGDIWDVLIESGISESRLSSFMRNKFFLSDSVSSKLDIIAACEFACRKGGKKLLSPGAMSDFPDRYDGFHTYNRCCRALQDTGRSKENLKSYTKDRRAFEYWSDGNIHAANMFMGSGYFKGTSADHIGAISLGFVHDPRYLRPMSSGDNSTKRDRLLIEDIEKILSVEEKTGIYPMSWYSAKIWEFIKINYMTSISKVATVFRDALKQSFSNYMYILLTIIEFCGDDGEMFLLKEFIEPKYDCFLHSYEFNEQGEIVKQTKRRFTERSKNEIERYSRIAFEAVRDYSQKENRNTNPDLNCDEKKALEEICLTILKGNNKLALELLQQLVSNIQERLILGM